LDLKQQPAIRKVWKIGFRPIWCAESSCNIYLSIAGVVLELQAKASQIPQVLKNSAQSLFTTLYSITNLQSEELGELVLDQFDALNTLVPSVCPWERCLLRHKEKCSWEWKIPPAFFVRLYHHFLL
jgi:hypothetical protein